METTSTIALHQLNYRDAKTYLMALLFVAGNILLPQLCHLVPQGGLVLLPIYFFTLIGSYKYGITVGMLTAILSPLANHVLFGMPPAPVLPILLMKSTFLAIAAAYVAHRFGRVSLWAVALSVVAYQAIGMLAEWGLTHSLHAALQDITLGLPGILLQIFGGYMLLRYLAK